MKNRESSRIGPPAANVLLLLAMLAPVGLAAQIGTENGEWRYWGGDYSSSRYAPLDQITAENFGDLEVTWIWRGDNFGDHVDMIMRSTPTYIDGILYTVAGYRRQVAAIDPETGETLWTFREPNTERHERSMRQNYGKGVAYAEVDGRGMVYVVTPGFFLHALDAKTGRPLENWGETVPIEGFPETGNVDLLAHMDEGEYDVYSGYEFDHKVITNSSSPIVVDGVIVVGNSHEQGSNETHRTNVPGDILAFDAATGDFMWRFDVIPEEGQLGVDTWESDAWKYTGNVSAWAPMSADLELGLVYVVTDGVTIDYYGGFYPGSNLFSTSIIALDIHSGERRWHYQVVHHDIWNYDNPTAPNLLDVTIDGEEVPIIVQTTKQGFAYTLNRAIGEPIWPIPATPVPASKVPGEKTWPTQPIPTWPLPFEMTGLPDSMIVDFTPELRELALKALDGYDYGPVFNPPINSDNDLGIVGSLHCPAGNGGANIPGGTVADPETGYLYIATTRACDSPGLVPGTEVDPTSDVAYVSGGSGGPSVYIEGIPPWKPPYGSIVAIDMNTGEHVFRIPNGSTPDYIKNHTLLQGVDVGNTGTAAHATSLVTKSLLMYGEGRRNRAKFHAVDKKTGALLGTVDIPAPTTTAPMTFMHEGKQYIVLPVAGGDDDAEEVYPGSLVALPLP